MEKLILGRSCGQPIGLRFLSDGGYSLDYKDYDDDYPGIREKWIHHRTYSRGELSSYILRVFGVDVLTKYATNMCRVESYGLVNPEHIANRQLERRACR